MGDASASRRKKNRPVYPAAESVKEESSMEQSPPTKDRTLKSKQSFFVDTTRVEQQQEKQRQAEKTRRREEKRKQKELEHEEKLRREAEENPDAGYSKYEAPSQGSPNSHRQSMFQRGRSNYFSSFETDVHDTHGKHRIKYTRSINVSDSKGQQLREAMRVKEGDELYTYIMDHMTVDDLAGLSSKELRGCFSLNALLVIRRICNECGITPPAWDVPFSEKEVIDEAN